jgi:hypothetical protein
MAFILERPELNATHVVAVLGLPAEEQRRFLDIATERALSGRALKQLVIAHRRSSGERRGRRRAEALAKSSATLRNSTRALKEFLKSLAQVEAISDGGRAKVILLLAENEELIAQCRTLLKESNCRSHVVSATSTAEQHARANSSAAIRAVQGLRSIELQTATAP